jgi:hypothetical protein
MAVSEGSRQKQIPSSWLNDMQPAAKKAAFHGIRGHQAPNLA